MSVVYEGGDALLNRRQDVMTGKWWATFLLADAWERGISSKDAE